MITEEAGTRASCELHHSVAREQICKLNLMAANPWAYLYLDTLTKMVKGSHSGPGLLFPFGLVRDKFLVEHVKKLDDFLLMLYRKPKALHQINTTSSVLGHLSHYLAHTTHSTRNLSVYYLQE